jgi:hypothetical protein
MYRRDVLHRLGRQRISVGIKIPGISPPSYSVRMDKLKKNVGGHCSDFVEN